MTASAEQGDTWATTAGHILDLGAEVLSFGLYDPHIEASVAGYEADGDLAQKQRAFDDASGAEYQGPANYVADTGRQTIAEVVGKGKWLLAGAVVILLTVAVIEVIEVAK